MGNVVIRAATEADLAEAAAVYLAGNADEAVFNWVIPDESARARFVESGGEHATQWLAGILATGALLVAEVDGALAGVAQWEFIDGPGQLDAQELAAALEQAYGEYTSRMMTLLELVERRHPRDTPHWYLQQICVLPAYRGTGLGGALLRHQLAEVDAAGHPAYLEASSPRNQALYARHGFQALGAPVELPGGLGLQPMWRPAALNLSSQT
ncbi:GNAT family N-acetyltransferase [Tamaricihabitans halophyticus]|uniref:GNAT family N-acetyltransferase n=1 Tax=Tamaricihabitans halophyticus TaxID=1262583 RepID=UPI001404D632|nr:GNAT family N-acetyltransferase [Tamaricihabitans halophyticus]